MRESLEESRRDGLEFKAPKTEQSKRAVLVSEALLAELRKYWKAYAEAALACGIRLTADALVFPASPDKPAEPRKPRAVSEAFSDRLTKYGIKAKGLSFHSLRHSHATMLLRDRVNLKLVSERLGHASPTITLETYAHVMPGDQQQAVEVMERFFAAS